MKLFDLLLDDPRFEKMLADAHQWASDERARNGLPPLAAVPARLKRGWKKTAEQKRLMSIVTKEAWKRRRAKVA
jgi:hypothetical protein